MFIAYNFSHLTYPPGKGIKFQFDSLVTPYFSGVPLWPGKVLP
jgi:hypothetical protein